MPNPVVIVGALDTKGEEFRFVRDLLRCAGWTPSSLTLVSWAIPHSCLTSPRITSRVPGAAAWLTSGRTADKARAMQVMADGLTHVVLDLHREGRLGGILGMAGGGGTSVATAAIRALPIGVPKLMASTLAGGDVSAYVGTVDITMMPTVVDVAGLNSISRRIYANAAAAIAGMVLQQRRTPRVRSAPDR